MKKLKNLALTLTKSQMKKILGGDGPILSLKPCEIQQCVQYMVPPRCDYSFCPPPEPE